MSSPGKGKIKMNMKVLGKMVGQAKQVEVVVNTTPRLNKFARTRGADGKRVACPFEGVRKHSKMVIDLDAKYVGEEEDDNNHITESWTKATDIPFIKESVKTPGKFYLWGKLVKSEAEFTDAKGTPIARKELAEYMPVRKDDGDEKEIWLKVGLDNIETVAAK